MGVSVLGAGASTRMGRSKLLLPWGTTSVVGRIVENWRAAGAAQIAVVHAPWDELLAQELRRLGMGEADCIVNRQPEHGMFSSIQAAARWTGWRASLSHFALALGDQPQISASLLRQLWDFVVRHPDRACQPCTGERLRHPVILPRSIFLRLADASEKTLREFLATLNPSVLGCPMDDPALDVDLDSPEDYAQAMLRFPP